MNPKYYVAEIKFLLAATNIHACLVVPLSCNVQLESTVKLIQVPTESYDCCLSLLSEDKDLRSKRLHSLFPGPIDQFLVYSAKELNTMEQAMSASRFLGLAKRVYHLNISELNVALSEFARSSQLPFVKSLDLSRLQIDDSTIIELLKTAQLTNLRWLDLSGNFGVTMRGVAAICDAIANGHLPNLEWLELLGTACDASPYIDGHYWRISEFARQLAKEYGFQRWMMLGSRIPELANCELLTSEQRNPLRRQFTLS